MRKALLVGVSLVLLQIGALPVARSSQTDGTQLTLAEVTIDSTSDWAAAEFRKARVRRIRIVEKSPGSTVTRGDRGFALKGAGRNQAVAYFLLEVGTENPVLRVRKGNIGESETTVVRLTGTRETVATVLNDDHDRGHVGNLLTRELSPTTLVGPGIDIQMLDDRRLVLAWYYPWFNEERFTAAGQWADVPRDPEDTTDPSEVARMVSLAAENGINGFAVSWSNESDHQQRNDYVFDAAEQRGDFWVVPAVEFASILSKYGSNPLMIEKAIRSAIARADSPAYLHVGDRPALVVYGARTLGRETWSLIRERLRSDGIDPFVVADTMALRYEVEGFYLYNPNSYGPAKLSRTYELRADRTRLDPLVDPEIPQRLWAAAVSPGMDSRTYRFGVPLPGTGRYVPRNGQTRFAQTWSAALGSDPEWVLVTSWNEWHEATHVAPSAQFGYTALSQTGTWSRSFASGSG